MTIKLDENLPERLVAELSALGHDVDTVRAEHLAGHDDTDVWRGAQTTRAGRLSRLRPPLFSLIRSDSLSTATKNLPDFAFLTIR